MIKIFPLQVVTLCCYISTSKSILFLFLKFGLQSVNVDNNLFAFKSRINSHLCWWLFYIASTRFKVCVLFALREVRMHAWSALHCLTAVFSRCHWFAVLCCAVVMVLCALDPAEWRKEQSCSAPSLATPASPDTLLWEKSRLGSLSLVHLLPR